MKPLLPDAARCARSPALATRKSDAEEVAQATSQLRRELLNLDVESVEAPGTGEPPPGARAVDMATLGALLVNFADPQMLASVVAAVRSLASPPAQPVSLLMTMSGLDTVRIRRA